MRLFSYQGIKNIVASPRKMKNPPLVVTAVSITLEPQRGFRELGDAIENAVDYASVTEFVKNLSAVRPRRLIETLADEIAGALLSHFPLRAVSVELRKFILPDTAFVAARVHRQMPA